MEYYAQHLLVTELSDIKLADIMDYSNMILGGNYNIEEDMDMYKIYVNTKTELDGMLEYDEGRIAEVTSDPTDDNNREYIKVGAIGLGYWDIYKTIIRYVDRAALLLAAKAEEGLIVTVDNEPGNVYVRNDDNTMWIPRSGNVYATADMPTDADFEIPTGVAFVNKTAIPAEWVYEDGL